MPTTAITFDSMLLTVGTLALAGFVQGLTGFGFGLIAMALLPLVIGFGDTQAIVALTSVAACVLMTGVALRHVQWPSVGNLWLGCVLGVPLGFWGLAALPEGIVLRLLGAALCGLVGFELLVRRSGMLSLPRWAGYLIGLVSGTLTGAFNVGGPPLVAYVYGQPWSKEEQVATLSAVFLSGGLMRLALLVAGDHLHAGIWQAAAWAVGPVLLAMLCGNRLLRFVSQRQLRTAVYLMLLILGGRYLFSS